MSNGEFDPYEAVIADLESKIAAMQATIENLRNLRGMIGAVTASTPAKTGGAPTFAHDAFFQMTASDAAKKFLSALKKTAPANVIADALTAGGWKSASKNVTENIRTILSRNDDFVKINGEFGLAEWYPGRKAATKKRVGGPESAALDFINNNMRVGVAGASGPDPDPIEPEQLSEQ